MADLSARTVDAVEDLGPARGEWDDLAVALGRPYSSPAWALAWWSHLRPAGAVLRIVLVHEGDRLVGVFPLFCERRSCSPLGLGVAPAEPLAAAGEDESAIAAAAAAALASTRPAPSALRLDLHGGSPPWSELLAAAWGGGRGAWWESRSVLPVPRILLGDYETWMAERSSTFQREMRRKQRKLEGVGGSFRYATAESVEADVRAFLDLHRARLEERGGSSLTEDGVERMLVACAGELLDSARLRLLCLEVDGKTVAAQLLLVAGAEVSGWNTGFDDDYAKLSPLMLCMLRSIADAAERDERIMSFGPGAQGYKYRLANDEDALTSFLIVPRGGRYPLVRLRLAAGSALAALRGRLGRLIRSD